VIYSFVIDAWKKRKKLHDGVVVLVGTTATVTSCCCTCWDDVLKCFRVLNLHHEPHDE
jgi:hypothetical protein